MSCKFFLIVAIYFINRVYFIEYGIVGTLIAPILYLVKNHYLKLVALIICCLLLTLQLGQYYIPLTIQWTGVFSAIILFSYEGYLKYIKRQKLEKIKLFKLQEVVNSKKAG
jgi:hypothetical protein